MMTSILQDTGRLGGGTEVHKSTFTFMHSTFEIAIYLGLNASDFVIHWNCQTVTVSGRLGC